MMAKSEQMALHMQDDGMTAVVADIACTSLPYIEAHQNFDHPPQAVEHVGVRHVVLELPQRRELGADRLCVGGALRV